MFLRRISRSVCGGPLPGHRGAAWAVAGSLTTAGAAVVAWHMRDRVRDRPVAEAAVSAAAKLFDAFGLCTVTAIDTTAESLLEFVDMARRATMPDSTNVDATRLHNARWAAALYSVAIAPAVALALYPVVCFCQLTCIGVDAFLANVRRNATMNRCRAVRFGAASLMGTTAWFVYGGMCFIVVLMGAGATVIVVERWNGHVNRLLTADTSAH